MTESQRSEVIVGLVVVLAAGLGIFWLIPTQITVSATGLNDLSPSLVPQISLGLCLLLGIGLILHARFAHARSDAIERIDLDETGEITEQPRYTLGLAFDLAIWATSSVAVMVLLPQVGFIVTAILLLAGWLVFTGVRSPAVIVGVSLILPVVLDRLSWYALTVKLP